ncbi:MAG TPA: AsmA-like C-terminal region-containing protein, partial [Gammaproteobacteria bacterium]|nr:AsmA-like C-terminal region-containing protein [Gammaproteobacteria bacterium]
KGRKKDITEFTAQGSAEAGAIMSQFKPMPGGWLEGAAAWRLDGRIPGKVSANTAAFNLALHSDLAGLGVDLPEPFTKPQQGSLPLNFDLKLLGKDKLSGMATYGDTIGARLDFVSDGDSWKFDRGNLNLGEGDVYLPDAPGFTVTGNVKRFSWDEWKHCLPPAAASAAPPGALPPAASPLPAFVQGADLTVGELDAFDQRLTGLHLLLSRSDDGWLAKLDSKAAVGTLTLPASVDADHPLMLDMDRLLLARQAAPKSAAPAAASSAPPAPVAAPSSRYDPRRIPALKFTGRHFEYGDLKLGNASFALTPLPDGVALQDLKVDSDTFSITGDGAWKVTPADAQSAAIDLDVKSHDVGKTLADLGFAPAITGSKGEINAALDWRDGPFGDIVHSLGGTLHVKLEDGQIVDVQPGAGRVFGLLSLNALPRRLLLNFSDVFAKGFGYDSIEGDFTLQDGDAYTKDLQVKGPAARITLIGRTGLARHDFDEALIVDPNVGSTLPVVGALAGGLGVGAVVLLLTEVFRKPISAAGETRYHLTGTWDNPVLTKENASPPAKNTP